GQVLCPHDAGVVDQDVEQGMLAGEPGRECGDGCRILDIEGHGVHPLASGDGLLQRLHAPPGHYHRVTQGVEAQRKLPADAGPSARDQHRIVGHLHGTLHSLISKLILQVQTIPPLAKTVWPLIHAPSPLHSIATPAAMSAGSPSRLWGVRAAKAAICSLVLPSVNRVLLTTPGAIALTEILRPSSSLARMLA